MTEADWLQSQASLLMLQSLRGKASDRKLRLFGVAAVREVSHLLKHPVVREAIEIAERYSDGLVDEAQLFNFNGQIVTILDHWTGAYEAAHTVTYVVGGSLLNRDAFQAARGHYFLEPLDKPEGMPVCANLLRDIFGNPFRPITVDPSWQTGDVIALAQAIYDERTFERMPLLADALEEAGCTDAEILNHCRQPGQHVRGCWVVDLMLGKS
jgi:hypothetical protein